MKRKTALYGLLIALAFIVSYLESLIPLPVGIQGIKLGLANGVVLVALYRLRWWDGLVVSVLRILLILAVAGAAVLAILLIAARIAGFDFVSADLHREEEERLKREAEVAALLGAPRMRHDSTGGRDANDNPVTVEEALPIVAEGYRRVTEFAAGLGVHTMIENHGYFFQDACRVKKLIETVNHPNFGWLMDMGNFMCADEKPVESVKIAAPMAVHAHAKDFFHKEKGEYVPNGQGWFGTRGGNALRGTIIGHGAVNVPECLKTLRAAGYDGWLSVEFEGIEDCITSLEADLKNLKEMLA